MLNRMGNGSTVIANSKSPRYWRNLAIFCQGNQNAGWRVSLISLNILCFHLNHRAIGDLETVLLETDGISTLSTVGHKSPSVERLNGLVPDELFGKATELFIFSLEWIYKKMLELDKKFSKSSEKPFFVTENFENISIRK